jgi:D-alanine-D-alanine ligase
MASDRIRLVVLFGGRSAEHDVSCVTASHVLRAVDPARYDIRPVGITRDGTWVVAEDAARALEGGRRSLPDAVPAEGPDIDPLPTLAADSGEQVVVFPLLHGPMGEDGTVQGLLELAGVPYVGSGVLGSALSMDKAKAKEVVAHHGIPQARYRALRLTDLTDATPTQLADELGLPLFVKPANMGSSIGVSKADDVEAVEAALELALSYDEWVVVEEALDAREIEVAVLGNEHPRASVPGEIVPGAEFYDYDDKYHDGRAQLLIPAPLTPEQADEVRALALDCFAALRAEGLARVDFFFEEGGRGFLLNEINTMPGFTPISMYPRLWEASGLTYPDLVDELVRLAVERQARRSKHGRVDR